MKTIILPVLLAFLSTAIQAQRFNGVQHANPEKKLTADYCSALFENVNGSIIPDTSQQAAGYLNILDWLEGRVAGLQVYMARNRDRIPVIRGSVAAVFVDEIRVDPGYLNSLSTFDIAFVKVIKEPFVGSSGAGPAVAIYTRTGFEE